MHRLQLAYTCAATAATHFKSNATGATWALTETATGDGLAHKVTIKGDMATNHSAKTALLTGTGPNGEAQTETLNLPNGTATVTSTQYFLTLTSVVPSATIGTDTMDIGIAVDAVSPWKALADRTPFGTVSFVAAVTAGSPTFTVQHSYGDGIAYNHGVVAAKTASTEGTYTAPVMALRLLFAAAGAVALTALQA